MIIYVEIIKKTEAEWNLASVFLLLTFDLCKDFIEIYKLRGY